MKYLLLIVLFASISICPQVSSADNKILNEEKIAPLEEAFTFARYVVKGKASTLLVKSADSSVVIGYNIQELLDYQGEDLLNFLEVNGPEKFLSMAKKQPLVTVKRNELVEPLDHSREDHIAAGGNYPEHAKEAALDEVFLFPKISKISPPNSFVLTSKEILLDYEVEVCAISSRDIKSVRDFEQSYKGVFLCGDYSDRAKLLKLINVEDVESGIGFTDAKSGNDRLPVGEFMVVPLNFETFINKIEFSLAVNGKIKQSSIADKMVMKFDELIEKTLNEGQRNDWIYQGQNIKIMEDNTIKKGQIILSGTPEGVVFNEPSTLQIIKKSACWILTGSFREKKLVRFMLDEYIKDSFKNKIYLQVGDHVKMSSNYLGNSYQKIIGETK